MNSFRRKNSCFELSPHPDTFLRSLVLSQRNFPKWQLPKGIFQVANFQNVQFSERQLPQSILAASLDPQHILAAALGPLSLPSRSARPHFSLRRLGWPNLTFGKLPLQKLHIWEIANCEIVTWVAFGKMAHLSYSKEASPPTPPPTNVSFQCYLKGAVLPVLSQCYFKGWLSLTPSSQFWLKGGCSPDPPPLLYFILNSPVLYQSYPEQ